LCLDTGAAFEVSGTLNNLISKSLLLQDILKFIDAWVSKVMVNLGEPLSGFDGQS
jgi:hypothetical protein